MNAIFSYLRKKVDARKTAINCRKYFIIIASQNIGSCKYKNERSLLLLTPHLFPPNEHCRRAGIILRRSGDEIIANNIALFRRDLMYNKVRCFLHKS